MKVFIAGIMQGSRLDDQVESQDYRQHLTAVLQRYVPGVEIVDPWAIFPDSPGYSDEQGKQVFVAMCDEAGRADVLVAYAPRASMGTAIEMWQAYLAGAAVYCISPLTANWVVRFLSRQVFASIQDFEAFVAAGGLNGQHSLPAPQSDL